MTDADRTSQASDARLRCLSDDALEMLNMLAEIKARSWAPSVRDGQARMVELAREMNPEMGDVLAAYFADYLH